MHTLAELNPQAGDVVVFHRSYKDQSEWDVVADYGPPYWTLRSRSNPLCCLTAASVPKEPYWTLKQEKKVTVVHCQNPRYTLAQLNPKKGNKVFWHQPEKVVEYEVVRADGEGHWFLRLPNGEGYWFPNCSVPYDLACWTLKPQPKETKVTPIKDLNLVVGDRIQSGDWTGTFLGIARHHPFYYQVVWDWCSDCGYYALEAMVDWVRLPQTEPTLASLNLKAGDPVLLGVGVVLVKEIIETEVVFTMGCGSPLKIRKSHPLKQFTRCQKLEVPK